MKINDIFESRKNPEQNKKSSVNNQILAALHSLTDDEDIFGIPNLFVSFTSVDKLGINPKSSYKTPYGIYSYPAEYVANEVGYKKEMSALPFAGQQPFVNIFQANGEIVKLSDMYEGEFDHYFNTIKTTYKEYLSNLNYLLRTTDSYLLETVGGKFWFVTMKLAEIIGLNTKRNPSMVWNGIFRKLGIDGCIDDGAGIIHPAEPTQAVFFSLSAIKNLKRIKNNYSPNKMLRGEKLGKFQKKLNTVTNDADKLNLIKKEGTALFAYLPKNTKHMVLRSAPEMIKLILHPSVEEQQIVLSQSLNNISYIKHPADKAVSSIVQENPELMKNEKLVFKILNTFQFVPVEFLTQLATHQPMMLMKYPRVPYKIAEIGLNTLINNGLQNDASQFKMRFKL